MKKNKSQVSPDLIAAYRSARYQVGAGADAIRLRIDRYSEPLLRLFAVSDHQCAAFITACNPFSVPQSQEENQVACARLYDNLNCQP
ncbi:MAG: DUF3293 domain-containing protein, partial [Pseudomonadota bacterium]|nr:DUF3293 domain-containing protein [Pseudomonadota bacterium]